MVHLLSPSPLVHIEHSAQHVINLLEQGSGKTALSRPNFFTQALRVWDATLRQADMDEFLNVACVGVEKAMGEIALIFEELFTQAIDNYYDILGATFMLAHLAWKDVGDEYTPWDLVQLVVRLNLIDFTPPQPGDPPVTIYDPCCGSGAFLLGVLDYMDTYYPEVLDRGQINVCGQELTHVGWMMCRINLRLHQLARCIRRPWTSIREPVVLKEVSAQTPIQQRLFSMPDSANDVNMRAQRWDISRSGQLRLTAKLSYAQAPDGLGPLFALFDSLARQETDE